MDKTFYESIPNWANNVFSPYKLYEISSTNEDLKSMQLKGKDGNLSFWCTFEFFNDNFEEVFYKKYYYVSYYIEWIIGSLFIENFNWFNPMKVSRMVDYVILSQISWLDNKGCVILSYIEISKEIFEKELKAKKIQYLRN